MDLTIIAKLPKDRNKLGALTLTDASGEVLFGPRPVLGLADIPAAIAHGNPTRNPLRPFGNTPTGLYHVQMIPEASGGEVAGYGPFRRFLLVPLSGPCVEAECEPNNRAGLLIHGGKLNPAYTQWSQLRPTYGCLRVHDPDMQELCRQHDQRAADNWRCSVIDV